MGLLMALCLLVGQDSIATRYSTTFGEIQGRPVADSKVYDLPYLTWGADVATFVANGDESTKPDSIFAKHGLQFRLVNGDDFTTQVKNYVGGKTPYLRGTLSMLGLASEVLNHDPATKPVILFQMSWSIGDHMVSREGVKNLNDLKGKKICLQGDGPHLALVDDALRSANLKWSDITVVWSKNLTGEGSPAELFKKDASIDACCVISPDMISLTGGLTSKGSGAEGTVKGAKVLVSTASMSRSIADIYAVRQDYFKAHHDECEKFAAAYFEATQKLLEAKKEYNDGKGKSPTYTGYLKLAQKLYGEKVLPTLEIEAHGLVSDAGLVGLPGNISFFTDTANVSGFQPKQKQTLDLVKSVGFVKDRLGFGEAGWDYKKLADIAGMKYEPPQQVAGRIQAESVSGFKDEELDEKTLVSFTIQFKPNQTEFSTETYGAEFKRVVENASRFGNAVFLIRGHSDPAQTLIDFVKAGQKKGSLTKTGTKGNYKYYFKGQELSLESTQTILDAISSGEFKDSEPNPHVTMTAASALSQQRANNVRDAVIAYAKASGMKLDPSQIQPQGVGIKEPVIPRPINAEQSQANMRVEFRLIKVAAEAIKSGDYDY
jgi:outer membrane protein OmpA-like peptidoglycan-associated protein